MSRMSAGTFRASIVAVALVAIGVPAAVAQSANRDAIADLLDDAGGTAGKSTAASDPRAGDADYERAKALMAAIDAVLKETAEVRAGAAKLPSRNDFILPPMWSETREDRDTKVRALLESALAIVTEAPVVEIQRKIEDLRKSITDLEAQNAKLEEKKLVAPKDATLAGILTDTVGTLEAAIVENRKRIEANRAAIVDQKSAITDALKASGLDLDAAQVDLLLDSVLSGDLVRLVAVFNAAKLIDGQLAKLINTAGDNMNVARRYFAMHAALFAMLVHAQDAAIAKIDTQYMPKLEAIISDIKSARKKTLELLKASNRPDQKRALDANLESQTLASDAAAAYRRYLQQQREQIAKARIKAVHDLRIADNTYETVEASVQLRNLMRESAASFEAIQKLEAPSFEQIFKNDDLRREFDNLTRRLDIPSS
jgi:hypothetical protein